MRFGVRDFYFSFSFLAWRDLDLCQVVIWLKGNCFGGGAGLSFNV